MTYAVPTVTTGTAGKATTASVSIAKPSAVRIGDLLVLVVASEATATGIAVPAGFVPIISELSQGGAVNLRAWYKFATHAEPSTYTYTLAAADDSIYNLFLVRGVDPYDAINITDSAQASGGLPVAEPGVITTVDNCLAIAVLAFDGSPRVLVQPAGWTAHKIDDGPAGSICLGIAYKTIATAGASGGGNWTATDSTADDYIALTLAITPGVMGRAYSILYTPQQLLAKTLADCSEFRNLVGAADHAAAFAKIWHEALPPPADGARKYSLAELQAYRPYALVFLRDPDGMGTTRQASAPGAWSDHGSLWIRLVLDVPDGMDEHPVLLDHLVKQTAGRIMRCPPDETASTFFGLMDLSGKTNETDGYSYLACDDVLFKGWMLSADRDAPELGDFIVVSLEAQWGRT